jgi:alpha-tubulin suppressor-like RCC1 family protein
VDKDWHRWDGRRWKPVKSPDPVATNWSLVATDDGANWTVGFQKSGHGYTLTRRAQGRKRTFKSQPMTTSETVAPVAGGQVCVVEAQVVIEADDASETPTVDSSRPSGIVCYGKRGESSRYTFPDLLLPEVGIAPDGAVWVLGPQPVRLITDVRRAVPRPEAIDSTSVGAPVTVFTPATVPLTDATEVATGGGFTCAVVTGGQVACWGEATGATYGPRAVPVPDLAGIVGLAGGGGFACALDAAGGVRCWGGNSYGQLGDGTTQDRTTAVPVAGLTGVTELTAGSAHACALTSGRVQCWGNNEYGELGDGTTSTNQTSPVTAQGVGAAVAVVAGAAHTCALQHSGRIKCWGGNDSGQLGDGTTRTRQTPVTVKGISGVRSIAAGGRQTCAIMKGGTVRCWGMNPTDYDAPPRKSAVSVRGVRGAKAIAVADSHACAVASGGRVRCWGDNEYGQLGDGTTKNRTSAVTVKGLTRAVALSSGGDQTCALTTSATVVCWGSNDRGQLGDGTQQARSRPVTVTK